MASNYPGSLDSFDAIASDKKTSDTVGGRTHRDMHNDLGDAIEAIEAELGTDPSGGSATVKARFEVIEANDWVTAARIAANAVGSSELADNAVDTAAIQDSAVTSAKIADGTIVNADINAAAAIAATKVAGTALVASAPTTSNYWLGNVVQPNVADGTDTLGDTTGFVNYNAASISSDNTYAYAGSRSLKITGTNAARGVIIRGTQSGGTYTGGDIPLTGGAITAQLKGRIQGTLTGLLLRFYWWQSDGTTAASTASTTATVTGVVDTWCHYEITATPPADAAYGSLYVAVSGSGSNDCHIDRVCIAHGYPGDWSAPGVVVPSQGRRKVLTTQTSHYTLVKSDADTVLQCNWSTAKYVTVAPDASVAWPVGTTVDIIQVGAGAVIVQGGSGVTVNGNPGLTTAGQWAAATLIKRATNTWVLTGNLTT